MAAPGVELALGVVRDGQFGPLVMIGAGGVLVEVLGDHKFALPPFDADYARHLIEGLRLRPLLDGKRGQPPADLDSLARTIARFSVLAADLADSIAELDVNPILAGPSGAVALDALVIPRSGPARSALGGRAAVA